MNSSLFQSMIWALLATSATFGASPCYADKLTVHEWGTFTSLQNPSGQLTEGLDHEEESLPDFVHSRAASAQSQSGVSLKFSHGCKGCDWDTTQAGLSATEKMETPVIYFYSDTAQKVAVDVDFPGGIITQFFPDASQHAPALGQVHSLSQGHVHWDLDVSTQPLNVPSVPRESIWAPSRETHSNAITVGGENEKLLFYRGLGRFETPVRVTSNSEQIQISNNSEETIPAAFVLRTDGERGTLQALGTVPARGSRSIQIESLTTPSQDYLSSAENLLVKALVNSGLYEDEAHAMFSTWKTSYFKNSGTRILYVLPRAWTDRLLPLHLQPAPQSLVRTLVGRVEILTQREETELLSALTQHGLNENQGLAELQKLGRFGEPKLRALISDIGTRLSPQPAEVMAHLHRLSQLVLNSGN